MPPQMTPPAQPKPTSSLVWIIGIVVLVAIALYLLLTNVPVATAPGATATSTSGVSTTASTPAASGTTGNSPAPAPAGTKLHSFVNALPHFTFSYPYAFSLGSPVAGATQSWTYNSLIVNNIVVNGNIYASVLVPQNYENKTNFADARFTVGASSQAEALSTCTTKQQGEVSGGAVKVGGLTFQKFEGNNAGAGNFYDTVSYRTVHNGACWALEYTIHTLNIGNFPPSAGIIAYDRSKIATALDAMVASFRF